MSTLTVGSLFAGIGGFDLGLERTGGFEIKWQVEIDEYCRRVLEKHWPHVRRYGDIREVSDVEPVDVLCGGFPCQDISYAGLGAGIEGARSGLWSEYARLIREVRPRFILVENVTALLGRGIGRVLGDLAAGGYDAQWDCIPASALGAPHIRDRVWIVAYRPEERPIAIMEGLQTRGLSRQLRGMAWSAGVFRVDQPPVLGADDGVSRQLDRHQSLGNAIVPQIATWIGNRILEHELQFTPGMEGR